MILYFIIMFIVLLICYDVSVSPNYPPGPIRYPLIGSFLEIQKLRKKYGFYHLVWDHLTKTYGNVFSVKLGLINAVVVSGYENVQYVMRESSFDGRPDGYVFRLRAFFERLGIVFVDGPVWKEHRRFLMRHFSKLGLGGDKSEAFINEEIRDLMWEIKKKSQNGTPVEIYGLFDVSVLNSLWTMVAGQRFALDDPRLIKLMELVHRSFRMLDMSGGILNQMPLVRYVAPERSGYNDLKHILYEFYKFLKESVDEHKSEEQDDYISAFLLEIEKEKESPRSFTEKQLLVILLDLFMAGSETTSSTLSFAILLLTKHPDVQAKVYEELETVIGDHEIRLQDRAKLSYLDAVLMEVQRHSNVAPLGIAHKTVRASKIRDYTVPENTLVLASLWSVHMDKDHWGDPETFRPERFLDPITKEVIGDSWFLPFGVGRRRCPGEVLAKANTFVFIAKLIQTYKLSIPEGVCLPDVAQEGITVCPAPFTVVFTPRN